MLSGSARRPGDIHQPHWFGGLDTALDVTVVTPVQGSLTARAARAPGVAAEEAHQVEFIPMAVKTWGGWHGKALETLSRQLARQAGRDKSKTQHDMLSIFFTPRCGPKGCSDLFYP